MKSTSQKQRPSGEESNVVEALKRLTDIVETASKKVAKHHENEGEMLAIVRLIPDMDLDTWQQIQDKEQCEGWFALELTGNEPQYTALYDSLKNVKKEDRDLLKKNAGIDITQQTLVHANEKQFLFFGTV